MVAALCMIGMIAGVANAIAGPEISGTVSDITYRIEPAGHSLIPSVNDIGQVTVALSEKDMTLYARSDAPQGSVPITIKVKELRGYRFSSSATDAVAQAVLRRITSTGIGGVAVSLTVPASGDEGQATVNVLVAKVAQVRAKRFDDNNDVPASAASIIRNSPVQTGGSEPSLLTLQEINNYIQHLNRFPRRSVTASVSQDEQSGSLLLDYLIQEDNFHIYAEMNNFGSDATSEWIQNFGIFATQLAGNDDILSVQGSTGNFEGNTQSVNGYYDSRLFSNDDIRWRISGYWGDYTAADVGFLRQEFTGSTWGVQVDLVHNIYQKDSLFLDLDLGVRYWNSKTQSTFFGFLLSDGDSNFITPSISITAYDVQPTTAFQGKFGVDYTNALGSQSELDQLGRLDTDQSWVTLYASAYYSFYIDSLFDSSDDESTGKSLVHEITLRGQGQHAFGSRLTPQAMTTMGGFYTVRGYRQAAISGDSSVQGTAEYRLHLLRGMQSLALGKGLLEDDFQSQDSATRSSDSWGLSILGFVDVARVWQSSALSFEDDATLLGAGVGLELSIHQNFRAAVNYGWALRDLAPAGIESGSGELYFLGSITF